MPIFDARTAECLIFTYKEGLLSKVAHDLKIRVNSFTIEVADDFTRVSGTFDVTSLVVVSAMHDGREDPAALGASDRKKIESTIKGEVLHASRGREVRFMSRAVTATPMVHRIDGDLTLAGVTRPLSFDAEQAGRDRIAEVRIHQPDFGIKPYSAMLGALRLKPEVLVRVRIPSGS